MKRLNKLWTFSKGFILLNILWYIFSLMMNSRILPSPIKIYANLPNLLKDDFYLHINTSLYRVGIGLFISFYFITTLFSNIYSNTLGI